MLLWAVDYHFHAPDLRVFVDDVFSIDMSGVSMLITHPATGESREVPLAQAKVLLGWTHVGLPWACKKQITSPTELIVLGHLVSIKTHSATIPPAAVDSFRAAVATFLSQPSATLLSYWEIIGWANWALSTLPFARFAIDSLRDKVRGKTKKKLEVPHNKAVRRDLQWFADELLVAPPLYFLDPALQHWEKGNADRLVYCDACLVSDDSVSSGLGFWSKDDPADLYSRHSFYCRIEPQLTSIYYAEALAVFSVIVWALEASPDARRLLIFTDSALTVYAFDTGRAEDPIRELVRTAYALCDARGVDLRVRHVPGPARTSLRTGSRGRGPRRCAPRTSTSSPRPPTSSTNTPSPAAQRGLRDESRGEASARLQAGLLRTRIATGAAKTAAPLGSRARPPHRRPHRALP